MFHKLLKIDPIDNMILLTEFIDGTKKTYDIKPLVSKYKVFETLKSESIFKTAYIDVGGYGVVWNEDLDLSSEEIWENGITEV